MTSAHGYILTAAEAADRLRVPVSTVRRWLWSAQLPGYRVGGMSAGWRIREADIEQFRGMSAGRSTPDVGDAAEDTGTAGVDDAQAGSA